MIIKKCVFNAKLMEMPLICHDKREYKVNGGSFDNGTEGMREIKTRYLRKTLSHKACLMMINTLIDIKFSSKHPF